MQDKKQQLEPDMKQQTYSKLRKVYFKAVYCHPACVIYMKSTSCKMLGGKTQAGIKIAGRNTKATDKQMTSPLCERN